MIGSAELLGLVDLLYRGAMGGVPWPDVMAGVVEAFDAEWGGLSTFTT